MERALYILSIIFLLGSCSTSSSHSEEGHHGHDHGAHEEGDKNSVSLTKAQEEVIGLQLGKLEKRNMGNSIVTTGELSVPPQNVAKVSAPIPGRIADIFVVEGEVVAKGQKLAYITDPGIIEIQEEYLEMYHNQVFLEQEYNRKKTLLEKGATSEKEWQKSQSAYQALKGKLLAHEANMRLIGINPESVKENKIVQGITLVAPICGSITQIEAAIGAYSEANSTLFELLDNKHLHADLRVFEKDIYAVQEGQIASFHVQGIKDKTFQAKIFSVGKKFEDDPKTIHLHAEIINKTEELIAGSYIQGKIEIDSVLTDVISNHGVVSNGDKHFIFVLAKKDEHNHVYHDGEKHEGHDHGKEEKNTYQKVEVVLGQTWDNLMEVKLLKPLARDVKIVTYGAYYLEAEIGKSETEHTH